MCLVNDDMKREKPSFCNTNFPIVLFTDVLVEVRLRVDTPRARVQHVGFEAHLHLMFILECVTLLLRPSYRAINQPNFQVVSYVVAYYRLTRRFNQGGWF